MEDEINTREKKIINDILFHLDGWRVNDHPKHTRKIDSFLDPDEPHHDNTIRKEVSSREVLRSYELAKIHALNYIRRKEFPNNPAIYQAICYWAAGLLSERSHFKDEKIQESTLLIEEARKLLAPHVKRNEDFFLVSGDEFFFDEYLRSESYPHPRQYRIPYNPDDEGDEEKGPLIHGRFHDNFKPFYSYRKPHKRLHNHPHPHEKPPHPYDDMEKPVDWIRNRFRNKFNLNVEPIISNDGMTARLKATVSQRGKPCKHGKLLFYIYNE